MKYFNKSPGFAQVRVTLVFVDIYLLHYTLNFLGFLLDLTQVLFGEALKNKEFRLVFDSLRTSVRQHF